MSHFFDFVCDILLDLQTLKWEINFIKPNLALKHDFLLVKITFIEKAKKVHVTFYQPPVCHLNGPLINNFSA